RPSRENLDDAADLLVAADDRVELALTGELGEVPPVLLERLVRRLGIRRGDALVAAHLLERGHEPLARHAERPEHARAVRGEREEEVLDAQILVLERPHLVLGLREELREPLGDVGLARTRRGSGDLRLPRELALEGVVHGAGSDPGRFEEARREALGLLEEREEEVLDVDALMAAARCQPARVLESLLDLVGHAVDVDHSGREPASGGGPGQPAAAIAAAEQRRSALAPGEEPGRGRSEDIEGAADEMAGLVPERPRDLAEAREHAAAALPQPRRARA